MLAVRLLLFLALDSFSSANSGELGEVGEVGEEGVAGVEVEADDSRVRLCTGERAIDMDLVPYGVSTWMSLSMPA